MALFETGGSVGSLKFNINIKPDCTEILLPSHQKVIRSCSAIFSPRKYLLDLGGFGVWYSYIMNQRFPGFLDNAKKPSTEDEQTIYDIALLQMLELGVDDIEVSSEKSTSVTPRTTITALGDSVELDSKIKNENVGLPMVAA